MCGWGYGSQGATLIFSYIRRPGPFFFFLFFFLGGGGGVQNLEFQYFWGVQKNEYFLGYENFVDKIFWGHHKTRLALWIISMHLRVFS